MAPSILQLFVSSSPILPAVVSYLLPSLTVHWTYTPRGLLYSHELAPFHLSPWAIPASFLAGISRLLQCCILYLLPVSAIAYCYVFWVSFALTRALIGYLLSRAVGWAFPPLFSHWALYEPTAGFGPLLLAYLAIFGKEQILSILPPIRRHNGELLALPLLTAVFCWLEYSPWTYGIAWLWIGVLCGINRLIPIPPPKDQQHYASLPTITQGSSSPRNIFKSSLLSFLTVIVPYAFICLPTAPRLPFPLTPKASPLLEILVLSHPRPNADTSDFFLSTTLSSFLPYLSPEHVVLSVFTHSQSHPSFDRTKAFFLDKQDTVLFHADTDTHPGSKDGHHLHLSELFRWVLEKPLDKQTEWLMLVEDDFPVCGGRDGWAVIETVMAILEKDRMAGKVRAGFVGTGGSGLIFHRSYLRLLMLILKTYSTNDKTLPSNVIRKPADVAIQDCLLGRATSLCERWGDGKLVISSRLVLDHIGGMATTTSGKALNNDKWRCGWRHAFHGDPMVDVVVV